MSADPHGDTVRAQVMAALLAGQSVNEVAKAYNVPKGTVSYWKNHPEQHMPRQYEQRHQIGDLLVAYLATNLQSLEAQARLMADPEWVKRQTAADMAVLHGVMVDKAVRMLEAFAISDENPDVEDQAPSGPTATGDLADALDQQVE